jgi:carboxylesterase type B
MLPKCTIRCRADLGGPQNVTSAGGATASSTLLPVLVFVHGEESYDIGSGNAYDGSVLSWHGQIVVITLNFRLGILGIYQNMIMFLLMRLFLS